MSRPFNPYKLNYLDVYIPSLSTLGHKPILPLNTLEISDHTLSAKDRIILVMGLAGAGKSTFIEYATQQSGGSVGHSLQSHASEIRAVRAKHPKDHGSVIFVDTPGFDDARQSDDTVLYQIAEWCVKAKKQNASISAVIYLHRISDNRMDGSPLEKIRRLSNMCKYEAMPRIVLGTTMWRETMPATGARREKELKEAVWTDTISQGCTVQRFEESYSSAWEIIGKLPTEQTNITLQQRRVNIETGGVTTQPKQLQISFWRKIVNFFTGKKPRK